MKRLKGIIEGTILAPKESVEKLSFFYFKYRGKGIYSENGRHKIRPDLFKLAVIMLSDVPLVRYTKDISQLKKVVERIDVSRRQQPYAILRYISFVEALRCFYDLNKDSSHGIIDKRTHLFEILKRRALLAISFLRKRTKKMSIEQRTYDMKGVLCEIDRLMNLSEED